MEEVRTPEQQSIFQSMTHAVWSGYSTDGMSPTVRKFLMANGQGDYIGALAFEPFHANHPFNQIYPFHTHQELMQDSSVYVVDALYLLPDQRHVETNIGKLLFAIVEFAIQNDVHQFVALPYYELLVAIRVKYRVNFRSLGPILPYQHRYVVPSVFNVSEFMEHHRTLYEQARGKYQESQVALTSEAVCE
jgi:hypothetical protein